MNIPEMPSVQKKIALELCSIKLYSTGLKKVFTNHFYKSMNHNFGVEIVIRNNTPKTQNIIIGGCVYDSEGQTVIRWNTRKVMSANSRMRSDFYVNEDRFSTMKEGKYKIQFWINNQKVQKEFFTVTYK